MKLHTKKEEITISAVRVDMINYTTKEELEKGILEKQQSYNPDNPSSVIVELQEDINNLVFDGNQKVVLVNVTY